MFYYYFCIYLCVHSQVEICGCENGGNCTTEGTTPSANPRILNCICPEGICICISITCTYNKTHI